MNSFPNWRATVSDNAYDRILHSQMILEPIEVREIVGLPGMDDAAESMESVESVESFRE